jgi:hypothetical protein
MKYIDYKGKLDLIVDEVTAPAFEWETGTVKDVNEAIKYIKENHGYSRHCGVPIHRGKNDELNNLVSILDELYEDGYESI